MRRIESQTVCAVFALLCALTACGGSGGDSGPGEADTKEPSALISEVPIEISIWKQNHDDISYNNEMAIWREVAKRTGVSVKFTTVPAGSSEDLSNAFALAMALGPDCDVYVASRNDIDDYGEFGAFLELNELVRTHAPTIARYLLDDPYNRTFAVSNSGKLYAVSMMAAIRASAGFFVRSDWLNRLNLEVPETPDDWISILRAFRDEDPNGNGMTDELPFWTRVGLDGLWAFGSAFEADTSKDIPWVVRDGKVVFGAMEPQFKEFVQFLNTLYTERLLDAHYLTRPVDFRDEALRNDIGGATHDWIASTLTKATEYSKEVDGLEMVAVPPPSIPGRSAPYTRVQMDPVRKVAWGITEKNNNPVATIKLMEYVYSDDGTTLFNFGLENTHHTVRNGRFVYTDAITSDPKGIAHALLAIGSGNFPYRQHIDYEIQYASLPNIVEARSMYEDLIRPAFPPLQLGIAGKTVANLLRAVVDYRNDIVNKFILGLIPIQDYEGFVEQLKEMGVDELQRIYQEAYDHYIGSRG